MSNAERPLVEEMLDYVLYAPLGVALTVIEDLPAVVQRGRERLAGQVGAVRFVQKVVLAQLKRSIEDVIAPSPVVIEESLSRDKARGRESGERAVVAVEGATGSDTTARAGLIAYDELRAADIVLRLSGLSVEELIELRGYEASRRERNTILARIDQLLEREGGH